MEQQNIINGFRDLMLDSRIMRAIDDMAFETPTEIQAQAIPLMRSGADIIGKSQTGTGKTMAFAIPAVEMLDLHEDRPTVQVLIMCPTRELALQCGEEIRKLTKYIHGVRPVEVYGGAPMDRQITLLKRANIVIGTPGRIMDHMRRKTLKLDHVKLVVLDEADEMLSMGFKEDMETILRDTPESRQTVLFSATMPPSILAITNEFQKDPKMVQVSKKQITLDNIALQYADVPMGRKTDALKLLLYFYAPTLAMVFCNTKKTADELTESLQKSGINADTLHGDLKQSQRNAVMERFRSGMTQVLVATDVAARGIDVNDVQFVFNYDIPQNNEYFVHRIGRTGRVGKEGTSVTICSGRRQVTELMNIVHALNRKITEIPIPTGDEIRSRMHTQNAESVIAAIRSGKGEQYAEMVNLLLEKGFSLFDIAAAALQMNFSAKEINVADIKQEKKQYGRHSDVDFGKIVIDIGRSAHAAPNHIVASLTERSLLQGCDIGKIEIYDDYSVVAIPADAMEDVLDRMYGAKVCGRPVKIRPFEEKPKERRSFGKNEGRGKHFNSRQSDRTRHASRHNAAHASRAKPTYGKSSRRKG